MPRQVLIKGYQIGYRFKGIGGYTEPYTDLPMIHVVDFAKQGCFYSADQAKYAAQKLYDTLSSDFSFAEWRIVEVWE